MGFEYGANHAWTVNHAELDKLNIKEWETIKKFLQGDLPTAEQKEEAEQQGFETYYGSFAYHENPSYFAEPWVIFSEHFKEVTGLEVELGYHDQKEGSRYDDVDGYFLIAYGVKSFTLAGAAAERSGLIAESWWVTAG